MTKEIPTPRIPGHCEPVNSRSLRASAHTGVAISIFRRTQSLNSGHCEPVTDVTGVAIPRLEKPGLDDEGDSHTSLRTGSE